MVPCPAKIIYAGPMLADDGETPTGSLIVADFENLAAARAFQKTDPYQMAGLFERRQNAFEIPAAIGKKMKMIDKTDSAIT